MNDSRLVQGLVIGSCIFLAFAVLMTWADVLGYRETADLGPIPQAPELSSLVAAVPAPGRPPGVPAPAPGRPAAVHELLKLAPEATWGIAEINITQLMQSQILRQLQAQQPAAPMGDMAQLAEAMALFLLPPVGQGPEAPPPGLCAVVKVAAGAREQLETLLAQQGQQATVAGMEGYKISGAPGAMGGGGLMAAAQGVAAFADDSTLLAADSEANLQAIAQAYRSGAGAGVSKELKSMLDLYSGSAVRLAVAPPQSILGQIARSQQAPGALGQMTAAAFGLNLDDQIRFKGNVRMSSAEAAGQLADQVNATLDQQKQQMQQQAEQDPQMAAMVQPMLGLLEKLYLSAEGNDLNVAIDVTPQELQGVMQMAMMMAMSGMMGGPAAGFGGGPPSPGGFGQ